MYFDLNESRASRQRPGDYLFDPYNFKSRCREIKRFPPKTKIIEKSPFRFYQYPGYLLPDEKIAEITATIFDGNRDKSFFTDTIFEIPIGRLSPINIHLLQERDYRYRFPTQSMSFAHTWHHNHLVRKPRSKGDSPEYYLNASLFKSEPDTVKLILDHELKHDATLEHVGDKSFTQSFWLREATAGLEMPHQIVTDRLRNTLEEQTKIPKPFRGITLPLICRKWDSLTDRVLTSYYPFTHSPYYLAIFDFGNYLIEQQYGIETLLTLYQQLSKFDGDVATAWETIKPHEPTLKYHQFSWIEDRKLWKYLREPTLS